MMDDKPVKKGRGKPKGYPKTGGRAKGTLDKRTQVLAQLAADLNCEPFQILIHFAKGDWQALGYSGPVFMNGDYEEERIPSMARLKAAVEACKYLYSQRKPIDSENDLTSEELTFLNIFRERMAEYAAKRVIEDHSQAIKPDSKGSSE